MKLVNSIVLIALAAWAAFSLVGCGDEEGPLVGGRDFEVVVERVAAAPAIGNLPGDPVWNNVEQASIWVGTDSTYTQYFGSSVVRVKAVTDGNNVFFRFDWTDSSQTDDPGRWYFGINPLQPFDQDVDTVRDQKGNYTLTQAEREEQLWVDEDVLAMFIDYGNNGSEGANCASTCHGDEELNSIGERHWTTGGGNIDAWVWRAGRTDPLGIAEDYFWGREQKYDSYTNELYFRNAVDQDTFFPNDPRWMHVDSADFAGMVLFSADTVQIDVSQNVGWAEGDAVPGWIHNTDYAAGNASRYDINAESLYDPQLNAWIVVLWRSMAAPVASEDVDFVMGESYEATLAIMRNSNLRHSGSEPFVIRFAAP